MPVSIADPWSPGLVGYEFNQFAAITYLDIVRNDRMKRNNLWVYDHCNALTSSWLDNADGWFHYPELYHFMGFRPMPQICTRWLDMLTLPIKPPILFREDRSAKGITTSQRDLKIQR